MNIAANRPLSNHPLFAGSDIDEAREVLSHLFTEVTLEPYSRNQYSTLINGVELPRSTVCYVEHPDGMIANARAPLDFHAIQLPLAGCVEFHIDGQLAEADAEHGVVLSAGEQVRLKTLPGNGMLNFIVGQDTMRDAVTAVTGRTDLPDIRFSPVYDPTEPHTASLLSLLMNFSRELNRPGGILESRAAAASFEHALITFMLFGLEHNLSGILNAPVPDAGAEQVRLVEEYINVHCTDPISMAAIARETGHSANSIFRSFRKHRDYTPMQLLRRVRMELARTRLLRASAPDSVSRIATECGFTHLGRFATDYRRRFGETPSETLARSLRQLEY